MTVPVPVVPETLIVPRSCVPIPNEPVGIVTVTVDWSVTVPEVGVTETDGSDAATVQLKESEP